MGSAFDLLSPPIKITPLAPLGDDEFIAFCQANEPYRFELDERGNILMMTPSGALGGNLEGYIFRELDFEVENTGRGFALNSNSGFRLPDTSLRLPDAAWITSEKWNSLSRAEQAKIPHFCPDFVVELRSPSDRAAKLERKMLKWMANGAQFAWLIDPIRKLAIIYRPDQQPETLTKPEVLEGEGPITGFRLEMERFWA